ncbi:MAG: hypothetical protein K9L30_13315 [Desulfobacterales bacterium]|nr:hypothetical protein [Desulfobacterales bacterium]
MKNYMHYSFLNILLMGVILTTLPGMAIASDVCSRGNSEPPFLAFGVKSNLLMLLDNSGSMLDTAYVNAATNCFDDNYVPLDLNTDPYTMYAGSFQSYKEDGNTPPSLIEAWYKWVDVQPLWEQKVYSVGDKVYANGLVYEALTVTGVASSGANIYDDEQVEWNPITRPIWKAGKVFHPKSFIYNPIDGYSYYTAGGGTAAGDDLDTDTGISDWQIVKTWVNGTVYSAGDLVQWEDVHYQAMSGGTASGTKPWTDKGVAWMEIDPFGWQTGTAYVVGDIVTYEGMIFEALLGHTSSGDTLYETDFAANWLRIDEGYYEEVSATDAQAACTTAAAAAGNTKYTSDGICITLYTDPLGVKPTRTTAFGVSGNFLNWLTASKFDIQKSILTGGKYYAGAERIVSENRGCSGSRFVKQVALDGGAGFLTLAVRGPRTDGDPFKKDRIDGVDDTTRIEVLAVSATGYSAGACQAAVDKILTHGINGAQNEIDTCLGATNSAADPRNALNHAMQDCWQNISDLENSNLVTQALADCYEVYQAMDPSDIANWSNAYHCYGIFDNNRLYNVDRVGYVGRCWSLGSSAAGATCDPRSKDLTKCVGDPCEYSYTAPGGTVHLLKNDSGEAYTQVCFEWKDALDISKGCKNTAKWKDFEVDSLSGEQCDPTDAIYSAGGGGTGAEFSNDLDGVPGFTADDTALLPATLPFNTPQKIGALVVSDEGAYCTQKAMEDYCNDLNIPEVIDPTDQETSTSGDYGNIPALLIDSGMLNQLGVDVPMNVMKGTALRLRTTPPVGILQNTASDLRIGAMAFNGVGAETECAVGTTTTMMEKYCPGTNRDGAQVISRIRLGSQTTETGRLHVAELVDAVNDVRATSWTPVAEAVYNALGYYTQNTDVRLNIGDFQTDSDVTAGWQNNYYYGPDSYLLEGGSLYRTLKGGYSDGGALLTDNGVNWTAVASYRGAWSDGTVYNDNDIVSHGGKLYQTLAGGVSTLKAEANILGLSGPLYDAVLSWDFFIDPVVNHCQANSILIISEGASTADINPKVEAFARGDATFAGNFNTVPIDDGEGTADDLVADQCTGGLLGSTYMDDLVYFAYDEHNEFTVYPAGNAGLPEADAPFGLKPKKNLTTYIVTAGALRNVSTAVGDPAECNPALLMDSAAANGGGFETALRGENPAALEAQLLLVINELRNRSSAGSAASVISSARGGEGAIYQAIFWPEMVRGTGVNETKVAWAGDVHGLFLDENGFMYEDTDGNRQLEPSEDLDGDNHLDCGEDTNCNGVMDPGEDEAGDNDGELDLTEDLNGNGVFDLPGEDLDDDGHFDTKYEDLNNNGVIDGHDKRVIIFFDNTPGEEKTRACWNTSVFPIETTGAGYTAGCNNVTDLEQVHFLWSASQWLSDYPVIPAAADVLQTATNRSAVSSADFTAAIDRHRYIFTWKDSNNDGVVDIGETVDFEADADGGPALNPSDFDVANTKEVDKIIRWMRGKDLEAEDVNGNGSLDADEDTNGNGQLDAAMRSRQSLLNDPDIPANTYSTTWRLGDIIHSTPMTVAAPAEGYHLIYNDYSYAEFLSRWKERRHMVYFGANDGMLHAVNGGFYNDVNNKFYLGYDRNLANGYNDNGPPLGKEMWAYVPYNLHPHLKCLTDPNYIHKYFVDQRPRIFDVQIFPPDDVHTNGWGTILVGGMRYGGSPILASELSGDATDTREFISSYFILDITNPEEPPVLLGELTQKTGTGTVDLGYSSVIPTMAIIKDNGVDPVDTSDDTNEWYLILGSGPHDANSSSSDAMKGMSDQGSKISVLPLKWLTNGTPLRIPAGVPTAGNPGGTYAPSGAQIRSFVSDMITVDYDINPSYQEYKSDAVYFGTVEGEVDRFGNVGFGTYPDGTTYWSGGGHMYRLVMEPGGHIVGKAGGDPVTTPDSWRVNTLLNLGSSTTVDFGTYPNGVRPQIAGHPLQPVTAAASVGTDGYNFWIYFGTGRFFSPEDKTDHQQQSYYGLKEPMEIVDDGANRKRKLLWHEVELFDTAGNDPGEKGLVKVDEILVPLGTDKENAALECGETIDVNSDGERAPIAGYGCMPWYASGEILPPGSKLDLPYFDKMEKYIAGTGRCINNNCTELPTCSGSDYNDKNYKNNCTDGWYKDFWPYENREKNVGQATLLGGLVTFTTYQPNSGVCEAEGSAYLYAVYYKTGTSWYEDIFGIDPSGNVKNKLTLGRGMATTPNLHVGSGDEDGDGTKAFVQTSTGEIKEINQDNLPVKDFTTGRSKWKEYRD